MSVSSRGLIGLSEPIPTTVEQKIDDTPLELVSQGASDAGCADRIAESVGCTAPPASSAVLFTSSSSSSVPSVTCCSTTPPLACMHSRMPPALVSKS